MVLIVGATLVILGLFSLGLGLRTAHISDGRDFSHDYFAVQALRAGTTIYAPKIENYHPPFDVLTVMPLAGLPFKTAFLTWSALSLVCFGLIIAITLLELGISLAWPWLVLLGGLALCWYPFQFQMMMGQWSFLIGACILGCWVLLRHDRDVSAGVLLGIASLIKLFPGLLILFLVLRRRWKALAAVAVTTLLGMAVTVAIVGSRDTVDFVVSVAPGNVAEHATFPLNASLTGLFSRLLTDGPWVRPLAVAPELARWLVILASLGLVGALARHILARPVRPDHDDTTFALACVAMLLISPLTWVHMSMVLMLPFGLLLRDRLEGAARPGMVMQAFLVLALLSMPHLDIGRALMTHYAPNRTPWYAALLFAAPTAAMLLLWHILSVRLSWPPQTQPLRVDCHNPCQTSCAIASHSSAEIAISSPPIDPRGPQEECRQTE